MSYRFPFEERAARVRAANEALMAAAARRRRTPSGRWDENDTSIAEWRARAAEFWETMRAALPDAFADSVERVKRGDSSGVELLLDFLEADPMYFRSGYLKADLLRWLSHVTLTEAHLRRLRAIVVQVVSSNWRREFHRYCLFAKRLDAPEFRADLERLAQSERPDVRLRANKALAVLDGKWVDWHTRYG